MREIKFRAWDLGAESMVDWESIKLHFSEHIDHEMVVVMQYTGLKDQNGNEIYEGDSDGFYIVKNGEFPVRCHETCEIIDKAHGWYLDPIDKSIEPSNWEIPLNDFYINRLDAFDKNIYDNPELIKTK